jgi:hypothetical protein
MPKRKVVLWGIENFTKTFEVFQTSKVCGTNRKQLKPHRGECKLPRGFNPWIEKQNYYWKSLNTFEVC